MQSRLYLNKKQIWREVQKTGLNITYQSLRTHFVEGKLPGTNPGRYNIQKYIRHLKQERAKINASSRLLIAQGVQKLAKSKKIDLSLYIIGKYIEAMPKPLVQKIMIHGRPSFAIKKEEALKCITWLIKNKRPYESSGKYVGKLNYVKKSQKGSWNEPKAKKEPPHIRELAAKLREADAAIVNIENKISLRRIPAQNKIDKLAARRKAAQDNLTWIRDENSKEWRLAYVKFIVLDDQLRKAKLNFGQIEAAFSQKRSVTQDKVYTASQALEAARVEDRASKRGKWDRI